ncbi:MAG: DUF370 domain-containing protein [Clostridia bacterium]|jgi:hypothetical protein|nr:DUF370 domain-containing protein [Clostridia bacterium]
MLLHIGENRFVPSASIVAIVPADNVPAETDRLIHSCAEAGRYYPSYGTPKSYVVCVRDDQTYVYAASTAIRTLKERIEELRQ